MITKKETKGDKMSNLIHYSSLTECYPIYGIYRNEILPSVSVICYTSFLNEFGSCNEFSTKAICEVEEKIDIDDKKIYLCMLTGGIGGTQRVRDYYKVWKTLGKEEYDLERFSLDEEVKICFNKHIYYAGIAKVLSADINIAINIMQEYCANSFLYIASNNFRSERPKSNISEFFNSLLKGDFPKLRDDMFDYVALYNMMCTGDCVINVATDGEEMAMYIVKKE